MVFPPWRQTVEQGSLGETAVVEAAIAIVTGHAPDLLYFLIPFTGGPTIILKFFVQRQRCERGVAGGFRCQNGEREFSVFGDALFPFTRALQINHLLGQIHAGTTVCSLNEKVAGQGSSRFGRFSAHGLVQQIQFGLPGGGEGFILCWVTGTVGIVNALGFV